MLVWEAVLWHAGINCFVKGKVTNGILMGSADTVICTRWFYHWKDTALQGKRSYLFGYQISSVDR